MKSLGSIPNTSAVEVINRGAPLNLWVMLLGNTTFSKKKDSRTGKELAITYAQTK